MKVASLITMKAFIVTTFSLAKISAGEDPPLFLTEAEIDASRGGKSRSSTGLHVSSSDNFVEPLIEGSVVMSRLYEDLERTRADDFIHATFWELDLDVQLVP